MSGDSTRPFTSQVVIDVNGNAHDIEVDHRWTLLHVLREVLDLTGAKRGCDRGECGACTVLLGGVPVNSCQILAMQVGGRPVETVEGLGSGGGLHAIQQAYLLMDGGQCGFCTPGFVMSTKALLDSNPAPSRQDIRDALTGNTCRCNAYGRIIASVEEAARTMAEG